MYELYLGRMLLPVTPEKISLSIRNKNETLVLIDGGEINIPKEAGLTEISFSALLPQAKYPFARYEGGGFQNADVFVDYLEQLKASKAPFQFILNRMTPAGKRLFDTNMSVTLEEYSIDESAGNGFDLMADIRLKQWRAYGTKIIEIGTEIPTAPVVVEEERPVVENPKPSSGSSGSKKTSGKGIIATSTGTKEAAQVATKVAEYAAQGKVTMTTIPGMSAIVGRMPTVSEGSTAKAGTWSEAIKNAVSKTIDAGSKIVNLILGR